MALDAAEMKARFKTRIHDGLQRVYASYVAQGTGYPPIADAMWQLLADAISDIAIDVVFEMQNNAKVVVGIPVTTIDTHGDTGTGATTAQGTII